MKLGLIANLLSFLLITALTGFVSFLLEKGGLGASRALALWIVSLVVLLIVFYSYRQRVWLEVSNRLAGMAMNRFSKRIGLAQVYNSFDEATPDVKRAFEDAHEARILIQLGTGIVGGDRSILFEAARKKKGRGFEMKLLYADKNSPYLSQDRARQRKTSNFREWMAAISYTEGNIEALLEDGINIDARRHCEPYLWRLFFFDQTLFFVPYLAEKDNTAQAPAFKFILSKDSDLPVYRAFSEYFEHLWKSRKDSPYKVEVESPS